MRLRLCLTVDRQLCILPINYMYFLSAWIYKTIYASDSAFCEWLHEQGYGYENKRFKLFTFSRLFIRPKWRRDGDRLKIYSGRAELQLSFYVEKAVEHFIIGLFQNQHFTIGDRKSKAGFTVQTVERLPEPAFGEEMTFNCLSPICISRTVENREYAEYLGPDAEGYTAYFFDNLLYKYLAAQLLDGSIDELREKMQAKQPMRLTVLDTPKSHLEKIKAGKSEQTFVRGYTYQFCISAPRELLAFGYDAGFGEKNSMGFGFVEN